VNVTVNVGTIFSIFRRPENSKISLHDAVLKPGARQVAAGYVVYGSSTVFVYTAGQRVFGVTRDPVIGAFVLSHENIQIPDRGRYYSVNEANASGFSVEYQEYMANLRKGALGTEYSSRYIGSLVADFHRTLLKGVVFLSAHPQLSAGKLQVIGSRIEVQEFQRRCHVAPKQAPVQTPRGLPEASFHPTPLLLPSGTQTTKAHQ